jgi:hypothetical protein
VYTCDVCEKPYKFAGTTKENHQKRHPTPMQKQAREKEKAAQEKLRLGKEMAQYGMQPELYGIASSNPDPSAGSKRTRKRRKSLMQDAVLSNLDRLNESRPAFTVNKGAAKRRQSSETQLPPMGSPGYPAYGSAAQLPSSSDAVPQYAYPGAAMSPLGAGAPEYPPGTYPPGYSYDPSAYPSGYSYDPSAYPPGYSYDPNNPYPVSVPGDGGASAAYYGSGAYSGYGGDGSTYGGGPGGGSGSGLGSPGLAPATASDIEALVASRESARQRKDWGQADSLRDQLRAKGVDLYDKDKIWKAADGRIGSFSAGESLGGGASPAARSPAPAAAAAPRPNLALLSAGKKKRKQMLREAANVSTTAAPPKTPEPNRPSSLQSFIGSLMG